MSENTEKVASQILKAVLIQFEDQRQAAIAELDLYMNNSIQRGGVVLNEVAKIAILNQVVSATNRLAEAEGAISSLQKNYYALASEEGFELDD